MTLKYGLIAFIIFSRHTETQNTSFRALLAASNNCEQDVGSFRSQSKLYPVIDSRPNQGTGVQSKVSLLFVVLSKNVLSDKHKLKQI